MPDDTDNSPLEEETLPGYREQDYYPIKFKDILNNTWMVHAKLGFDAESTSWLVRRINTDNIEFMLLKIYVANKPQSPEGKVYDKIQAWDGFHVGKYSIHLPADQFTLTSEEGQHFAYVYKLCGSTVTQYLEANRSESTENTILPNAHLLVMQILWAATTFHDIGIIHTKLHQDNMLLRYMEGWRIGVSLDIENAFDPGLRKQVGDRMVYESRELPADYGYIEINGLESAVIGEPGQKHTGQVMFHHHRAPEVILGLPWDSAIDLWSIGLVIWEMLEGDSLFKADENDPHSDEKLLAQIVSLIGPPPKVLLERSPATRQYWDDDSCWIARTPIPSQTLETRSTLVDSENKTLLLELLRKVLRWLPEHRVSAQDLYTYDRFVNAATSDAAKAEAEEVVLAKLEREENSAVL